jgi:hypothetical protein
MLKMFKLYTACIFYYNISENKKLILLVAFPETAIKKCFTTKAFYSNVSSTLQSFQVIELNEALWIKKKCSYHEIKVKFEIDMTLCSFMLRLYIDQSF